MKITLKNERFECALDTHGAEINSVKLLKAEKDPVGTSYIWDGDASVWKYHAPILFPYTGRIYDGIAIIENQECKLGVNGFARDLEHKLISSSSTSAEFELTQTQETLEKYPYKFSLRTFYELTEKGLTFKTTVTNTDEKEISFSLGSHSAFCCPRNTDVQGTTISDYVIEFENKEPLNNVVCTEEGYLASDADGFAPYTRPYEEKEEGFIALSNKGFGNGHLFTAFSSNWVGLRNKKTGSIVKVNTKDYPYLMIWQNAGDPRFVCIEPWYGTPDPAMTDHKWENKVALLTLGKGESFTADQSITIE